MLNAQRNKVDRRMSTKVGSAWEPRLPVSPEQGETLHCCCCGRRIDTSSARLAGLPANAPNALPTFKDDTSLQGLLVRSE